MSRRQTITPLRALGAAIALLWPFALRPLIHTAPVSPVVRTMVGDAVALIAIVLVMRAERITFDEVGLRWPSWKDALWAIGLALVSLVVSSALQLLFPLAGPSLANTIGSINVLVAIPFVLIVAFAEELTFRGYLIGVFSSNIGRAAAFFLSTGVFGLAHARTFGFNGTLLAPLVVGALFAGFYVWRRNLTACVMGHALIDYLGVMLISSAHAP